MSSKCIVIITDNGYLSQTISNYMKICVNNKTEAYFMTYGESMLTPEMMKTADLIILGLFRCYGLRVRAEGVMVAKSLAQHAKPFLIVSGLIQGDKISCRTYWDLASRDEMAERATELITQPIDWFSEIKELESHFAAYCFPPDMGHHG